MMITPPIRRELGTMIVYGYPRAALADELALAARIGATRLEILPDWKACPDPRPLVRRVADAGLTIHSAHGCWGGQTVAARQVDLASLDPTIRAESLGDIRVCIDWSHQAGAGFLVVHPGGLSDPADLAARRGALIESLGTLAPLAKDAGVMLCVENMPPGVHPGSRMTDLAAIVAAIGSTSIALALDTGHAAIRRDGAGDPTAGLAVATRAAGRLLATTHVHDTDGRRDLHWSPGKGVIAWDAWMQALDAIDYRGVIMLECVRHLRDHPDSIDAGFLGRLGRMTGLDRS